MRQFILGEEGAELPIKGKSGPTNVGDAVGSIVGWPKELVIFPKTKTKKERPQPFAISDVHGHREKFKDVEKKLPIACKYVYSYAVRLMAEEETKHINFDQEIFRCLESVTLLRDDILRIMEMREIGGRRILAYMGYLYKYLKERNRADDDSFVDPTKLTHGVGKDGSTLSQHIASQLEASSRDNICLIPYNTGYHWILTVINEEKNVVYLLDSMGNKNREDAWKNIVTNGVKMYNAGDGIPKGPGFKQLTGNLKQRGCVECGYCVMRYMKEIVECEGVELEKKFGGSIKNQYYNQTHYEEVRSEWSEFVYFYVSAYLVVSVMIILWVVLCV